MSIQVNQLSKVYGAQKAVDDVTFEVHQGDILGFLGPNGAGKSTTMKIATGYVPPSSGEVLVTGLDVVKHPEAVRRVIGYLPEHNPLYLDMYVHEYLGFIASLHGIKGSKRRARVIEMIGLCGLRIEQNKRIGALSKGYRQRVGLAQALIHDPKVLILDEPTTGLDPNQLAEIRKLIKEISRDKTVILSTHIMQEVKALCNRVVIINRGRVVADDAVERLTSGSGAVLTVEFQKEVPEQDLASIKGVTSVKGDGLNYTLSTKGDEDLREVLFKLAAEKGWVILSMQRNEQHLEDIFYELTAKQDVGDV